MNSTVTRHLLWKEYRAIRGFWLAIVLLVVLLQWIISGTTHSTASLTILYSIGLAAPAFFAVGAAGAAFAIEREEGTFDFLRAAPVPAGPIFATKVGLAAFAALLMLAVLTALTAMFTYPRSPDELNGMLGLWLVAIIEAIAWGTLFSLLSARPLAAVVMAVAAASTIAHLVAWSMTHGPIQPFELKQYLAAVPVRLLVAIAVLGVDTFLGLRWLGDGVVLRQPSRSVAFPRWNKRDVATSATNESIAATLMSTPDRAGTLGRLVWLQWRQAGWLMAVSLSLAVAFTLFVVLSQTLPESLVFFPLFAFPTLMGCFVFRADQEQSRFRFFIEHQVPPRKVWAVRQLAWLAVLLVAMTIILFDWIGPRNIYHLWQFLKTASDPWAHQWGYNEPRIHYVDLPPVRLVLMGSLLCFAAGQWASMMVRSGIMAAVVGLALAAPLCGWLVLMTALEASWLWSMLPIPLVLIWATWLRAPDWVRENTSRAARVRAAASIVVPACVLAIMLPIIRVYGVPNAKPWFDVTAFEATITPAVKETADLYRRANDRFQSADEKIGKDRMPNAAARKWLDDNSETLALVLDASQRGACVFDDPRKVTDPTTPRYGIALVQLVIESGRLLESEGQLDAALDRYFTALTVYSQIVNNLATADSRARLDGVKMVFAELVAWSAHKGQTPERIRGAIHRLEKAEFDLLRLEDRLKTEYVVARRYALGDAQVWPALYGHASNTPAPVMRWPKFMPWEGDRGVRRLDALSGPSIDWLRRLPEQLREEPRKDLVDSLPQLPLWYWPPSIWNANEGWNDVRFRPAPFEWLADEFTPQLNGVTALGDFARLCAFELVARRRGTILLLAIQSYRLEHHELPQSLDDLAGSDLDTVPRDPYSGREFAYFPHGLPQPSTDLQVKQLRQSQRVLESQYGGVTPFVPGMPCIWCTGPFLQVVGFNTTVEDAEDEALTTPPQDSESPQPSPSFTLIYTLRMPRVSEYPIEVPEFLAWARGFWFPIPPATGE